MSALAKRLRLGPMSAELRAEVFNVLNRVNLDQPVNNLDNPEFGRIINTIGGPRTAQFGVRLSF